MEQPANTQPTKDCPSCGKEGEAWTVNALLWAVGYARLSMQFRLEWSDVWTPFHDPTHFLPLFPLLVPLFHLNTSLSRLFSTPLATPMSSILPCPLASSFVGVPLSSAGTKSATAALRCLFAPKMPPLPVPAPAPRIRHFLLRRTK
ncbi:hypothetical protein BLNAU_11739 [Blattamonas nauphoetae]|uniref:Uncharacterized protein n=1 Tax=Blattamonas nauphoetae TaxID=2049346 RepID=A0ABQ9XRZ1_9EUKA|nr:hypothetical protein BLNAU_11739 [Blattamonas nauphoetae]